MGEMGTAAKYSALWAPERKAAALVERRALPCMPEIEKLVIGGIFNSDDSDQTFREVSHLIEPSAFSLEMPRLVFLAIGNLAEQGLAIDRATVEHELQRKHPQSHRGSIGEADSERDRPPQ
jgi:replicative DNA helicase